MPVVFQTMSVCIITLEKFAFVTVNATICPLYWITEFRGSRINVSIEIGIECQAVCHNVRNIYQAHVSYTDTKYVFIHCSQHNNTANYGRPLILAKTHVVLVRVACGSNIRHIGAGVYLQCVCTTKI